MTFTVSYDLEEEEDDDTERILQLMIILEVEYGDHHLCLTAFHSCYLMLFLTQGFDINLYTTREKYHILGICYASLMFHSETYLED